MTQALLLTLMLAATNGPAPSDAQLMSAIERGDKAQVKVLLNKGARADARDADGMPAIVKAAVYGDVAMLRDLLDRGADPNATDKMGITALSVGAGDPAKAKLLVGRGANVNSKSKLGRTPLMVAAGTSGAAESVKLLLAHGAKVEEKDSIEPIPVLPTGGGKGTALIDAARAGDLASVRMLIAAGANVNATSAQGITPLSEAAMFGRLDVARLLLERGAKTDVHVTLLKTPLMSLAAMRGDAAIIRLLASKGAPVNATDGAGVTPLMWAAANDRMVFEAVEALLEAGADPKAVNKQGESALDWAMRRGVNSPVATRLRQAGAPSGEMKAVTAFVNPNPLTPREAVSRAIEPLAKSGPNQFKKGGCVSCHHNTLPLEAFKAAAAKGIHADQTSVDVQMKQMAGMVKPFTPVMLEGSDVVPDLPVSMGYVAEAMAAREVPASLSTAAILHDVMQKQQPDGRWIGWAPRTPMEGGDIQATAYAIRSMTLYPIPGRQGEINRRVDRARTFLATADARTTEEVTMKLLGLVWAQADSKTIRTAAKELAKLQRTDGGWGQLAGIASDAYATGKAVYALRQANVETAGVEAATKFLLSTQHADGTWMVATRSFPFQPLADTGFPHGRDQWISAAATSWAALALTPAIND